MRPDGPKPPSNMTIALAKAFHLMKYDVGLLAEGEARAFSGADVPMDATRKTASEAPVTVLATARGDEIRFVRFPSLPEGRDLPSDDDIKRASRKITAQQGESRLVVALSDWGWLGEREFLAQNPKAVPDILLGSGLGSGVNGRIEAQGRCLWVRPYDKGRTLNRIELLAWPDRSKPFKWQLSGNVRCLSVGLGDQYMDDPDVSAILQ